MSTLGISSIPDMVLYGLLNLIFKFTRDSKILDYYIDQVKEEYQYKPKPQQFNFNYKPNTSLPTPAPFPISQPNQNTKPQNQQQ